MEKGPATRPTQHRCNDSEPCATTSPLGLTVSHNGLLRTLSAQAEGRRVSYRVANRSASKIPAQTLTSAVAQGPRATREAP
jgi:hypothetical protein